MITTLLIPQILKVEGRNINLQKLEEKLRNLQKQKMSFLESYNSAERYMNSVKEDIWNSKEQTERMLNSENMRYPRIEERYQDRKKLLNNLLEEHEEVFSRMKEDREKKEIEFNEKISKCNREIEAYKRKEENKDKDISANLTKAECLYRIFTTLEERINGSTVSITQNEKDYEVHITTTTYTPSYSGGAAYTLVTSGLNSAIEQEDNKALVNMVANDLEYTMILDALAINANIITTDDTSGGIKLDNAHYQNEKLVIYVGAYNDCHDEKISVEELKDAVANDEKLAYDYVDWFNNGGKLSNIDSYRTSLEKNMLS